VNWPILAWLLVGSIPGVVLGSMLGPLLMISSGRAMAHRLFLPGDPLPKPRRGRRLSPKSPNADQGLGVDATRQQRLTGTSDRRQLWVPSGFGHGFCTAVEYKLTNHYNPECSCGLQ